MWNSIRHQSVQLPTPLLYDPPDTATVEEGNCTFYISFCNKFVNSFSSSNKEKMYFGRKKTWHIHYNYPQLPMTSLQVNILTSTSVTPSFLPTKTKIYLYIITYTTGSLRKKYPGAREGSKKEKERRKLPERSVNDTEAIS